MAENTDIKISPITASFIARSAGSIVRHLVTAGGGILVYKGATTPDVVNNLGVNLGDLAGGVAVYAAGQGWSLIQKYRVWTIIQQYVNLLDTTTGEIPVIPVTIVSTPETRMEDRKP